MHRCEVEDAEDDTFPRRSAPTDTTVTPSKHPPLPRKVVSTHASTSGEPYSSDCIGGHGHHYADHSTFMRGDNNANIYIFSSSTQGLYDPSNYLC